MRAVFAFIFVLGFSAIAADSIACFFPLAGYNISATAAAKDTAGNTYITGFTQSNSFPTTAGAFQTKFGGGICVDELHPAGPGPCADAFVIKLDPNGVLIYATYLGGNGDDRAFDIVVDGLGNAYIAGATTTNLDGTNSFPVTSNPLYSRGQTFVAKINATGNLLVYATFFPIFAGTNSLAADSHGNAFVAGGAAPGFQPTPGAFESTTPCHRDAIAKVSADGATLLYAACFDEGLILGVTVDAAGSAYFTGSALSGFPLTPGALHTASQGIFAAKLNAAGSALIYAAIIGDGQGTALKVDSQGQAYVLGTSTLVALNAAGSALVYSAPVTGGSVLDVDASGNAYVAGAAGAGFAVSSGAFQRCMNGGGADVFIAELSSTGSLIGATYLGGSGTERPLALVVLAAGQVSVAGVTDSADFPGLLGGEEGQSLLFSQTLQINNASVPDPPCIALALQNGASFAEGPIAPLEIITIRGAGIGPDQGVSAHPGADGNLPTQLGGVHVLIDGEPVPLMYVQADQINAIVPYWVDGVLLDAHGPQSIPVQVQYNGAASNIVSVPVAAQSPGIFMGRVVNEDGTLNSTTNPARIGSVISLFGTGGAFILVNATNAYWPLSPPIPFSNPDLALLTINGTSANILYGGSAPGSPLGVMQINVQLPSTLTGTSYIQFRDPPYQPVAVQIANR